MTAENGASSGTVITLNGCSISEVRMILKVTLFPLLIDIRANIINLPTKLQSDKFSPLCLSCVIFTAQADREAEGII